MYECNLSLYIGQTVPQVLVLCISVAVFAKVAYYPTLEYIICQKVSQHVQDTCSLVSQRVSEGGGEREFIKSRGHDRLCDNINVEESYADVCSNMTLSH